MNQHPTTDAGMVALPQGHSAIQQVGIDRDYGNEQSPRRKVPCFAGSQPARRSAIRSIGRMSSTRSSACEGRISVSKRRHGLQRCRYRGDVGMKRWVGLGIIADNLINIGRFAVAQSHA
jgi:hypothetical protein